MTFLAGLARISTGRSHWFERASPLRIARERVGGMLSDSASAPFTLASLWRLTVEDLGQRGQDPVVPLAAEIGRRLDGELPLHSAGPLLEKLNSRWWSGVSMNRLRILLCERAWRAGYEVVDLLRAGRAFPPLGTVLAPEPAGLAHLRLMWAYRQRRPWERFAKAVDVFEIAADPHAGAQLAEIPDILLADRSAEIELCGRGVLFQGRLFTKVPESIAVRENREFQEGGFDLFVGEERFHFASDPDELAGRLERWLRLHLGEFLPQAVSQQTRHTQDVLKRLGRLNAVVCPECHNLCLPQFAEIGIRTDPLD